MEPGFQGRDKTQKICGVKIIEQLLLMLAVTLGILLAALLVFILMYKLDGGKL